MSLADRLREEGIQIGVQKTMSLAGRLREEGMQLGVQKGVRQGMQKGQNSALNKVAVNLLRNNEEPGYVAQVTGLSVPEVEAMMDKELV